MKGLKAFLKARISRAGRWRQPPVSHDASIEDILWLDIPEIERLLVRKCSLLTLHGRPETLHDHSLNSCILGTGCARENSRIKVPDGYFRVRLATLSWDHEPPPPTFHPELASGLLVFPSIWQILFQV